MGRDPDRASEYSWAYPDKTCRIFLRAGTGYVTEIFCPSFRLMSHVEELRAQPYEATKNKMTMGYQPMKVIAHAAVQMTMIRCTSTQKTSFSERWCSGSSSFAL